MQLTVILSGERIMLTVKRMQLNARLVDITMVGNAWRELTDSTHEKLELQAVRADGKELQGVFKVLSRPEVGVLEIAPWPEHPVVGDGE